MSAYQPEYVAARKALLDALDALREHVASLVLIGAQAIYLHTGSSELSVPPFTTDADLALDTDLLSDDPEIGRALRHAGFEIRANPGHWVNAQDLAVDLMVAPHQSGRSSPTARAARLPPHDKATARIGAGLALALTDNGLATITALDPRDKRRHQLKVAGPTALLVAKTIKIQERLDDAEQGRTSRVVDKDAFDIFRLLQGTATEVLVATMMQVRPGDPAHQDTQSAVRSLRRFGGHAGHLIPQLAMQTVGDDPTDTTVPASFAHLVQDLLQALDP